MSDIEKAMQWHKELLNHYEFERATYEDTYGTGDLTEEERKEVYEDLDGRINMMKATISALEHQLTNGWIPVSERLPKENGYYNVSVPTCVPVYTAFFLNGDFYYWMSQTKIDNISAWRYLPEPYKEAPNDRSN